MSIQSYPSDPAKAGDHQAASDDSRRLSTELAHQLVRHLGIKGARKTCTENHWDGVLEAIDTLHRDC